MVQFTPGSAVLTPLAMPLASANPAFASRGPGGEVYVAAAGSNSVLEIVTDQPPIVATGTPAAVTQTTATVPVTVDTRRLSSQVRVEFGPTTGYGSQSAVLDVSGARGATALALPLAGLAAGTTYHARAVATNAGGTRAGADVAFTTAALPLPKLVSGRVTAAWRVRRKRTRVVSLAARGLAKGVTVDVRCSGGGCPFTRKRLKPKTGATSISLTRLFKNRTLRAGRTIEVRITKTGSRGRVVRFKTRATATPKRTTLCLPVGSTRPGRC